jgi:hypothetical protein
MLMVFSLSTKPADRGLEIFLEARWDGIWSLLGRREWIATIACFTVAGGLRQGSSLEFRFVGSRGRGFLFAFFFAGHFWVWVDVFAADSELGVAVEVMQEFWKLSECEEMRVHERWVKMW